MTEGKGAIANEAREAIERSYKNKIFDEEFEPTLIQKPGDGLNLIKENDAVIFFNFREDRARQLTKAFVEENFSHFQRTKIKNLFFVFIIHIFFLFYKLIFYFFYFFIYIISI